MDFDFSSSPELAVWFLFVLPNDSADLPPTVSVRTGRVRNAST